MHPFDTIFHLLSVDDGTFSPGFVVHEQLSSIQHAVLRPCCTATALHDDISGVWQHRDRRNNHLESPTLGQTDAGQGTLTHGHNCGLSTLFENFLDTSGE